MRWALPGGSVRRAETPVQCAHRELEEETTLVVRTLTYLWQFGGLNKWHHVFTAGIDGTALAREQNEIRACRWFSVRDLDTLLVSVPTQQILKLVLRQHDDHAATGGVSEFRADA
jgi:8-oxo-dGTP diphosphatase